MTPSPGPEDYKALRREGAHRPPRNPLGLMLAALSIILVTVALTVMVVEMLR